jgi:tRNA threonylcarbamoyladenosine biosynthesis protein TsaE
LKLFHIDLYRIDNPVDFFEIGLYDILDGRGVAAIEWADRLHQDDLTEFISITLQIEGDELRKIHITAYGLPAVNLLKRLENM